MSLARDLYTGGYCRPVPALVLDASSLCSKWGFGDGDCPDWVIDACDAAGIDCNAFDWHRVLIELVRAHLIPALSQNHEVEVYEIGTIHNPIRASKIDGIAIDDYVDDPPLTLIPEWVKVDQSEVLSAINRQIEAGRPRGRCAPNAPSGERST